MFKPTEYRNKTAVNPGDAEQEFEYHPAKNSGGSGSGSEIAVIGMAGKFPDARNIDEFWSNLKNGVESIYFFSEKELEEAGGPRDLLENPNYVKVKGGVLAEKDFFDASFFGYSPKEAEIMDPQVRIFHQCVVEALEDAGYDSQVYPGAIGLYAGASTSFHWEGLTLLSGKSGDFGPFASFLLNNRDFLCTRIAYKLNLKGPAYNVQSACSTSLVAIHLACQGLLNGECDMALAGGVTISYENSWGYLYQEGMIFSQDGHCRAFDEKAQGTVGGNGAGIVLLKGLEEAIADRDHIYAIIKGTAINNDGIRKIGFTAPSIEGQVEVIRMALEMAEIEPGSIGYLETHGTGTPMGDLVEVEALKLAFNTLKKGSCAIGSVKTNIGHLDAAAGIAGFIKTVLTLKHKQIPLSLHLQQPNPKIDFENSPFYVNTELREWKNNGYPLRAGVSSFGIGGTNAHVVLEEWSTAHSAWRMAQSEERKASLRLEDAGSQGRGEVSSPEKSREYQLILLSAKTKTALDKVIRNLLKHLKKNENTLADPIHPGSDTFSLADVAYTLQVGRQPHQYRKMMLCKNPDEAVKFLSQPDSPTVHSFVSKIDHRPVVFMFPGLGAQYVNMGLELYRKETIFRNEADRCFAILEHLLDYDIKEILYPAQSTCQLPDINRTDIAQLVIFIIEYVLAKLLIEWGITPSALIGYSFGEYAAACISGVMSLEDTLKLLVVRGRLIGQTPEAAMLSVPLPLAEVKQLLVENEELDVAIDNGASCIVAGAKSAVNAFEKQMKERKQMCLRLIASHAIHTKMMSSIQEEFAGIVKQVSLNKPQIPYISNVTGQWITVEQALDPVYWVKHLSQTVQMKAGLEELTADANRIFLEVGPGRELTALMARYIAGHSEQKVINLVRNPQKEMSDHYFLLNRIGRLWLWGVRIDWDKFYTEEKPYRVSLPTYPFEGQRYWLEHDAITSSAETLIKKTILPHTRGISGWFYLPSWKRVKVPAPKKAEVSCCSYWLIFTDTCGLGTKLAKQLEKEKQPVITVKAGQDFKCNSNRQFTINPQHDKDYETLFTQLRHLEKVPVKIVHLWGFTADSSLQANLIKRVGRALDTGFHSLVNIARAVSGCWTEKEIQLTVVTNNLHEVTGGDGDCPEKATVLGPLKVIPLEYDNIACRCVDMDFTGQRKSPTEELVSQLYNELLSGASEPIVAYRKIYRWVQEFEHAILEDSPKKGVQLKQGGVYLVTGGLGGIGLELAQYLVKSCAAKLILTSRTPIPARDKWQEWIANVGADNEVSKKIEKVKALEAQGSEVFVLSADAADPEQMRQVFRKSRKRLGPVNGIIHCAGIPDGEMIYRKTRDTSAAVFNPKIKGTLVLNQLIEEEDIKPDFFILCSSVTALLPQFGQTAYCAANAFLDAFALYKNKIPGTVKGTGERTGTLTVSINWDRWQNTGIARIAEEQHKKLAGDALMGGITVRDGVEAFKRILQDPQPQVVVTPLEPQFLFESARAYKRSLFMQNSKKQPTPGTSLPRPELDSQYKAPRNKLEKMIAKIWQDHFGFESIGIYDDFFELGGDSLQGLKIVNLYQEMLGEIVFLTVIFDAPTIEEVAAYFKEHFPQAVARLVDSEAVSEAVDEPGEIDEGHIAAALRVLPVLRQVSKKNEPKNKPAIFVLSPPRSGSTLLRVILGGHPQLFAPPELVLLGYYYLEEMKDSLEGSIRAVMQLKGCDMEEAKDVIRQFMAQKMTTRQFYHQLQEWLGDRLLVDKTPTYCLNPSILQRAEAEFRNPLYIHLVRHPYGMIRSYEEARLDLLASGELLKKLGLSRRQFAQLNWTLGHRNILEFLKSVPANRQQRVTFENLVKQPAAVVKGICRFLDLDFNEEMLQPYKEKEQRMTDGIHPEGMMIGDVKFHRHKSIEANVADTWKTYYHIDFLGDITWELAESLGYRRLSEKSYSTIPHSPKKDYYALSSAQERLYILQQMVPGGIGYNMLSVVVLEGNPNLEKIETVMRKLIHRHESLRTSFEVIEDTPCQRIHDSVPFQVAYQETDETNTREMIKNPCKSFDLSTPPLFRISLVKVAADRYIMIREMHHIISDGQSLGIFERDFMTLYRDEPLPPLRIQYKDYARWQNLKRKAGEESLQLQELFWQKQFPDEIPILNLPLDFPRPAFQEFEGKGLKFRIDDRQTRALKKMAREEGTTLYMVLLAAFNIFLARITGQEDIVVGTDTSGRNHVDLENIIGMFVNTLALRNYPEGRKTFREFLKEVKERTLAAFENQDFQFENLVEKLSVNRDTSRNPLFDVMFSLQRMKPTAPETKTNHSHSFKLKPYEYDNPTSKFDLNLFVHVGEQLHFLLQYCSGLFERDTIKRFSQYYMQVTAGVLSEPDRQISKIEIIPAKEKEQLLIEFNNTRREIPRDLCYHQLLEPQVLKVTHRIAVSHGHLYINYHQLNKAANSIARFLVVHGVEPGAVVALYMSRGVEMLAAIIGIFKVGAAYLPLEPDYPQTRIRFILENSTAKLLITHKHYPVVEWRGNVLYLESRVDIQKTLYPDAVDVPAPVISSHPDNLAYIIYTSGTTGKPKGVMIHQLAMINHLFAKINDLNICVEDRVAQTASACFDISVWQFLAALLTGGAVHVIDWETILEPQQLLDMIEKRAITIMELVPSLMIAILDMVEKAPQKNLKPLRWMIATGEALTVSLVRRWYANYPRIKLVNAYGPTEAADDVTHYMVEEVPPASRVSIPIGKPLQNLHIYILDRYLSLCPVGVRGEICVAGIGVGKGYWQDLQKTGQAFIPNPYATEIGDNDYAVLYRTGDIGYRSKDGFIECLGRLDQQVKIRGNRIELGEIESTLMRHHAVTEAVVQLRTDARHEAFLCAYLVTTAEINPRQLGQFLSAELPQYMIPGYFVYLDKLPLGANGKVDRKKLPEPQLDQEPHHHVLPGNWQESKLLDIWANILEMERNTISTTANFFEIGGHSLKASIMVSKIHNRLGVKVPLAEVFKNATIKSMAKYIQELAANEFIAVNPIEKKEYYAQSSAQKRLFILQQMEPQNIAYNMPQVFTLSGEANIERLTDTFLKLIKRHESLRTCFDFVAGEPVQKIHEPGEIEFNIEYSDPGNRQKAIGNQEELMPETLIKSFIRPFDVSEAPLLRVGLINEGQKKYFFMVDMHHIAVDGFSQDILMREFFSYYRGEYQLPLLKLQYKDFSQWQNFLWQKEYSEIKKQEQFWLEQFEGEIPVINLPTDYPRPPIQTFAGGMINFEIDPEQTNALKKIGQVKGATLYMVLLAVTTVFLAKITYQEDIVVGSPVAGRRHADLVSLIGMFVNTLALRNFPDPDRTFQEFLTDIRERTLATLENQDYPFEELVEKVKVNIDASRNPLFDVMFAFQNVETQAGKKENDKKNSLKLKPFKYDVSITKFDLLLNVLERQGKLYLRFEYCTKLFKRETIQRFIAFFKKIAATLIDDPLQKLGAIEMITRKEKEKILLQFNDTNAQYPNDKTLQQLFAEQVEKEPDRTAVIGSAQGTGQRMRTGLNRQIEPLDPGIKNRNIAVDSQQQTIYISYRQLNEKSNQLAHLLQEKGVKPDTIVALIMERSVEMIVGIFGILMSGGAYLPIDPEYPEERIRYILRDSASEILMTTQDLSFHPSTLPSLSTLASTSTCLVSPANLAYIIYTSGSTGEPKGVMIEHRSVVNRLNWMQKCYPLDSCDTILQKTPYSFDVSVWELFWWSMGGARVCLLAHGAEKFPESLVKAIETHRVTVMHFVPPMLNIFIDYIKSTGKDKLLVCLRRVFASGEALTAVQVKNFNDILYKTNETTMVNLYGPTEATVDVSYFNCFGGVKLNRVPIGKPIDNINLYVVDKYINLQPIGVVGELVISGVGLARGYLNQPELTADRFIFPLPIAYGPSPLYKTGDLANWLTDGNIIFCGRMDHQVKIRGYRIELEEIEKELLRHPDITGAVIMVTRKGNNPENKLYAYITVKRELTALELKEYLFNKLPVYMVPAHFIKVDHIPLTANGKLDRNALTAFGERVEPGAPYTAPSNEMERQVADIWKEVLALDKVGIFDNFFDIGGNSMNILQVNKIIKERLRRVITAVTLYEYPTVSAFSKYLSQGSGENQHDILADTVKGAKKLNRVKKRLKKINQKPTVQSI